jgi:hypothetical protein
LTRLTAGDGIGGDGVLLVFTGKGVNGPADFDALRSFAIGGNPSTIHRQVDRGGGLRSEMRCQRQCLRHNGQNGRASLMTTEEQRCAEARKLQRVDDAFKAGDLAALRLAVDDPDAVPNGPMPLTIGSCLVYAVYHSPLGFVQELLERGADPNAPVDDGFPPLIAALTCTRDERGANRRDDVEGLLRLLLRFGSDPNQRGINDYTPLHMAVAERNALAVRILLDAGADPDQTTRIDDHETPLEMAIAAGLTEIAGMLARRGRPMQQRLRAGLTLLEDVTGGGEPVRRRHRYRVRLRTWREAAVVRWARAASPWPGATLEDDGAALVTDVRVDRGSLIAGLFYGMEGMRVGGMRRLAIAPPLAYGDRGVADLIPPGATLTIEVLVLASRS